MLTEPNKTPSDSPLAKALSEVTKYVVGFTLIAYASGFIITNLYLGSLGIVNLNLLRARYVLGGILFLAFAGTIIFLLYGLVHVLRREYKTTMSLLFNVAWYSMNRISVTMLAVGAVGVLAGSVSSPPLGVPNVTPVLPLSTWFDVGFADAFPVASRLFIASTTVVVLTISVLLAAVIVINPKNRDGVRTPRTKQIKEIFSWFTTGPKVRNFLRLLVYGVVFFLFLYLIQVLSSLLIFIGSGRQPTVNASTSGILPTGGWIRFFVGLTLIYGIGATFLSFFKITSRGISESHDLSTGDPTEKYFSWISLVAVATVLIVPVYALGIYPNLPQQVGGGNLVRVEVLSSDQALHQKLTDPQIETYLIDQSSDSILILLANNPPAQPEVMEIMRSEIKGLVYSPRP